MADIRAPKKQVQSSFERQISAWGARSRARVLSGLSFMFAFMFAFSLALIFSQQGLVQAMSMGAGSLVGDVQAGERKSVSCQACHGVSGISANPIWPNLAGQQEVYLANTLRAYRSGQRKDPLMGPMAAALSDQDIADLAAYYASLKP